MNILVVDDVPAMRVSLQTALEAVGHHVTVAESGTGALERLATSHFDVIVTDIWMPDGDGLHIVKQLRDRPVAPRIFVMTGGGPKLSIETTSNLAAVWGAEQVFIKPFDERKLIAAINV